MKSSSLSAFTLIELLVVIAILAILMGFIVPRIVNMTERARLVKAKTEVVQIAAAWTKYFEHYKHWPPETDGNAIEMNGTLTSVLLGDNPEHIPFYDAQAMSTNGIGGAMVNGWSNPIYVQFDQELDNKISVAARGTMLGQDVNRSAVAFSQGTNNQQEVWITSW